MAGKKTKKKATAKKATAKKTTAKKTNSRDPQAILKWFSDLQNRILRGDLMIGILSADEVDRVPAELKKAAEGGAVEAYAKLAEWYSNPPLDQPDYAAAGAALKAGIEAGQDDLKLELARLRWFKLREKASSAERIEAYELTRQYVADHPDDAGGLHLLGHLLTSGFGVDADPAAGYKAQKKAASGYCPEADFELYVHLSTGSGVAQDGTTAFKHLKKAADGFHPRALYNVASAYARGDQVKKDMKQAAKYYDEACGYGNGQACATLAAMYVQGDGVKKDLDKAKELFEEAGDYGFDASAIKRLVGFKKR